MSSELNDRFVEEEGRVVGRGDAVAIDRMLESQLEKVRSEEDGWTTIYRHRTTNEL